MPISKFRACFKLYFFFFPWLHPLKALELAVCERGPFPPASEGRTKEGQPFYLARLTCDNGSEPNAELPGMHHPGGMHPHPGTSTSPDTLLWQEVRLLSFKSSCLSLCQDLF